MLITPMRAALALAASLIAGSFVAALPANAATAFEYFVSPTGTGSTCTNAAPCSLDTAQGLVREHTTAMTGDIAVTLADGTYRRTQTLTLSTALGDSATNGFSVIYRAATGTHPVISGGQAVTGWTLGTNGIWQADVPAGFDTRQLYVGGIRATRASGALPTGLTKTSTGYTASSTAMSAWANPADIEMVFQKAWTEMRCGVASISGTTITMDQPCFNNVTLKQYGVNASVPTSVKNARELLTSPGQWYLNRSSHTLYYKPQPGETLGTTAFTAANLQTLVSGTGTVSAPLQNVIFRGLSFQYAGWTTPNNTDGFAEVQANMRLTGANAYSSQGTCTRFSSTNPGTCPYGAWATTPGNVTFAFTAGLVIERNTFSHLGAAGLELGQGTSGSLVVGNVFSDISSSGIVIGNGTDSVPSNLAVLPTSNVVKDNWVHDVGIEYAGAVGILQLYARNSTIEHNQINNVPYSAISSNWGWGYSPNSTTGNAIKNNLIFSYMQRLLDGGGIYVVGGEGTSMASGLTISGNVIRDSASGNVNFALYTDGGSQYITMTGNAIYGNSGTAWGGCYESGNPYGDFSFTGNYWDNATPGWPCGQPSNVTSSGNTTVPSSGAGVPAALIAAAGIEASYADILGPRNLALGRPAVAQYVDGSVAEMQPGSTPGLAVDGSAATFAQASGQYRWQLVVDLQSPQSVTSVRVTMPASAYATAFHIDGSTNGSTFSTVATITGANAGVNTVALTAGPTMRYLRVVADKPNGPGQTGGQMAISEVEAYYGPTPGANLALSKPATALYIDGSVAEMQPGSLPGYAVDGSTATSAQATNQYRWQLQVDLRSAQSVKVFVLTQPTSAYATAVHIDVSTDGVTFTTVSTNTGMTSGKRTITLANQVSARYVRVVADAPNGPGQTGGQMALSEFGVYALAAP